MGSILKEDYKGFQFVQQISYPGVFNFVINKNGTRYSAITLSSLLACKNVIDTYIRSQRI